MYLSFLRSTRDSTELSFPASWISSYLCISHTVYTHISTLCLYSVFRLFFLRRPLTICIHLIVGNFAVLFSGRGSLFAFRTVDISSFWKYGCETCRKTKDLYSRTQSLLELLRNFQPGVRVRSPTSYIRRAHCQSFLRALHHSTRFPMCEIASVRW